MTKNTLSFEPVSLQHCYHADISVAQSGFTQSEIHENTLSAVWRTSHILKGRPLYRTRQIDQAGPLHAVGILIWLIRLHWHVKTTFNFPYFHSRSLVSKWRSRDSDTLFKILKKIPDALTLKFQHFTPQYVFEGFYFPNNKQQYFFANEMKYAFFVMRTHLLWSRNRIFMYYRIGFQA